jgi:hypothetical protein
MGRLAGFSYREITKRLKREGVMRSGGIRKPENERPYRIILAIFPKVP